MVANYPWDERGLRPWLLSDRFIPGLAQQQEEDSLARTPDHEEFVLLSRTFADNHKEGTTTQQRFVIFIAVTNFNEEYFTQCLLLNLLCRP